MASMTKEMQELVEAMELVRCQLAISTSVLAGDDLTRPEVIVEENRQVLADTYKAMQKARGE